MKKFFALFVCLCLLLNATALAADYANAFTNFDQRDSWTEAVLITYSSEGVLVNGSGVVADGTNVTITAPGIYLFSGACENGQIIVDVSKEDKVQLVLSDLSLSCQDSCPLYIASADKVALTLAPGSVNSFSDATVYTREFEHMPNACIYARDDLTINGTGELQVQGNYNNGIGCKNDLKIVSGVVSVTAVKNALKGDDSVSIKAGTITLTAGKDAIKAETDDEAGKGFVYIEGGQLTITAGDDAIQGATDVTVKGGQLIVASKGKTINSKGTQDVLGEAITRK